MIKNKKTMCKILSVFLAFLIVAQILPLQVLAESVTDAIAHKEFIEDVLYNPTSEDNTSDAEILYEVEEKRDEYTKVYKRSDGTYTAIMTEEPLHYLNDGVWEEINNSMSLNGNLYTNLDNLFNVELPETIDSNENLTVEKDGYELSFSVDNIEESSAVVENDIVVSDTNIPVADEVIAQTQSSVTYNDIAENTDLQYIVTPNSIKENIIVSNKESVKDTYTFTFETNGLDAEKLDDGSVVFKDELNEIKFRIPRPVMTDSCLAFSHDICVDLIENKDGTVILEYSPSSEWINDSNRVYPITIDPAITVNGEEPEFIEDTVVEYNSDNFDVANQNNADAYLTALVNMLTQENSDGTTTTMDSEIYTKIDTDFFKNLGNDIVFTEVQYIVAGITTANGKIFAKEISQDWNVNTVTYNTKPKLSSEIIDYYTSPLNEGEEFENFAYVHFNITKIFNEWFNGEITNNGFAITASENTVAFMLINGGYQNTAIVLDYVDMGGYNENYSYHTQLVGQAGTGYVNDFTQQLSVIRDDIVISKDIPLTIGMTYNSATYDKLKSLNLTNMLAYGNKWLPNCIRAYLCIDDNYLTYYTDTGSTIDFIRSIDNFGNITFTEAYSSEYGNHNYIIEYTPEPTAGNSHYTITRPNGFVEKFDNNGLLISVTNPNVENQSIVITYDSMYRIDNIEIYSAMKAYYEYTENRLSRIVVDIYDSSLEKSPEITFKYDVNGNLTEVKPVVGKQIKYLYDENNMTSIEYLNESLVEYEYNEQEKVEKISEKYYDQWSHRYSERTVNTYDNSKAPMIKVIDKFNNYKIYQFNYKGKLLHTIDGTEDKSITTDNNNCIINGDFTDPNLGDWSGTVGCEIKESNINGKDVYALKIPGGTNTENTISQTVAIEGKKYDTIAIAAWFNGDFVKSKTNNAWLNNLISNSSDPKICNFTNDRYSQIDVSYTYTEINEDGNEIQHTETIVIPFSENFDDWQYVSDGFTLKGDCTKLLVVIRYSKNANPALLSDIQLTKNDGYNLSYYETNSNYSCAPLKSMSLGYRDVLSYSYNNNEISKVEYNDSAYQKSFIDFAYNYIYIDDENNATNYLSDIILNNNIKFHFTYDDRRINSVSTADNRNVRYANDLNIVSSFSNEYLNSVKNNGGNYLETINGIEYLTKVHNVDYFTFGLTAEASDVIVEGGKGISINSEQDWYGQRSKNTVEAKEGYNTDSKRVLATVESVYGYNKENKYEDLNQVKTYTNYIYSQNSLNNLLNSNGFAYEYDQNGNVIKEYDYISENSMALRFSYKYDEDNRIVRYNDNASDTKYSYSYEYDDNGKIVSKSKYLYTPLENDLGEPLSTEYYQYDNTNLLIAYNDENIIYDDNGNPTSFDGAVLTWNEQNNLVSYEKTDETNNITTRIDYCYDANGTMIEKRVSVNDVLKEKYNYTWAYGKLIHQAYTDYEVSENPSYGIRYIYDSFNSVQGFVFSEEDNSNIQSKTYLYLKNLQGDIVGILNESGSIILTYGYDVSGYPTTTSKHANETNVNFIETLPIKYRGCYYDYDTDLYCIDGKYYSPKTGGFIKETDTNNTSITDSSLNYSIISYWMNHPTGHIDPHETEAYYANVIANYLYNKEIVNNKLDYLNETDSFIDSQGSSYIGGLRYGFGRTGPVGCGWVATYNALKMLGEPEQPHDIIREFEMNGLFAYGCNGVNPLAIVQFFKDREKNVDVFFNESEYDTEEAKEGVNILLYTHSTAAHYIALKWDDSKGKYVTYNENSSHVNPDKSPASLSYFVPYGEKSILISIT